MHTKVDISIRSWHSIKGEECQELMMALNMPCLCYLTVSVLMVTINQYWLCTNFNNIICTEQLFDKTICLACIVTNLESLLWVKNFDNHQEVDLWDCAPLKLFHRSCLLFNKMFYWRNQKVFWPTFICVFQTSVSNTRLSQKKCSLSVRTMKIGRPKS